MRCHECGVPFEAVRNDAEICSTRCRVRRFRRAERERRARFAAEAERSAALLSAVSASLGALPEDSSGDPV